VGLLLGCKFATTLAERGAEGSPAGMQRHVMGIGYRPAFNWALQSFWLVGRLSTHFSSTS